MKTATKLDLNQQETERVDQLCAEFDPEQYVPEWMKERGERADWEGYLRAERHELRGQLEVAVLIGRPLARVDSELRQRLFYAAAQEITKVGDHDDYAAGDRLHKLFTTEESSRLNAIMHETCEAACRRALLIDSDPQMVAS